MTTKPITQGVEAVSVQTSANTGAPARSPAGGLGLNDTLGGPVVLPDELEAVAVRDPEHVVGHQPRGQD